MKSIASFIIGVLALLPIALVVALMVLAALAQEVDNRSAARIRAQWTTDKAHLLKVPALYQLKKNVQECTFDDDEISCVYSKQGEIRKVVAR